MEKVTISVVDYDRMRRAQIMLQSLEAIGVDGWEGYEALHSDMKEHFPEEYEKYWGGT